MDWKKNFKKITNYNKLKSRLCGSLAKIRFFFSNLGRDISNKNVMSVPKIPEKKKKVEKKYNFRTDTNLPRPSQSGK